LEKGGWHYKPDQVSGSGLFVDGWGVVNGRLERANRLPNIRYVNLLLYRNNKTAAILPPIIHKTPATLAPLPNTHLPTYGVCLIFLPG
jgi:hypothetical protein